MEWVNNINRLMSKPIKVSADLGQTYTYFWAAVFAIILVAGSVVGFMGTRVIKQPVFARLIQDTKLLQNYTVLQQDIAKHEKRLNEIDERLDKLEGKQ